MKTWQNSVSSLRNFRACFEGAIV